jgi:hypothetical protein
MELLKATYKIDAKRGRGAAETVPSIHWENAQDPARSPQARRLFAVHINVGADFLTDIIVCIRQSTYRRVIP